MLSDVSFKQGLYFVKPFFKTCSDNKIYVIKVNQYTYVVDLLRARDALNVLGLNGISLLDVNLKNGNIYNILYDALSLSQAVYTFI